MNKGKFDTYSTSDGLISYPNCETYYPIQIKTFLGFTTGIKFGSTYAANQSLLIYADLSSGISIPATLTAESGFQMLNAMDVDGDGNDELVKMNSAEVSSTAERVTFIDERYSFDVNYGGVLQWDGLNSPADRKILTGDFLGNGKQSVLTITYNKNKRDVAVQSWATLVDFDNKTKSSIYDKACFSLNPYDLVFTMDFDGDRKTDICRKIGNTVELYSGELILIATDATINHPNDAEMLIGDINGDEKTDILVSPVEGHLVYGRCEYCLYCLLGIGSHCTNVVPTYQSGGNTWTVYFSKGTSAGFESQTITSAENGLNTSFMLQDMNGDDIPDLVANINGSLKLYPSVNGKLGEIPDLHTVDLIGGAQAFLIPGNADSGDKMSQFFSIYNYELNTITFDRSIAAEQLLTGTVSSEGIVSKIQYSRNLNDYNFYNRGTACSYPYQKLSGNLYLHASTESFLSGNRTSAINKNYTRGMIDLRGKGFLGFEQIQTYDEIRNKTSTQGYNPSGFGLLTSVDNSALSASFIYNISVATNKIAKVTLSSKSETDKLSNVTVNSTYAYDSYGNATSETKSYGNGITITKNNLYNNYTGTTYKLGELYQQTLTNLRNGQTYIEKTYIPVFDSYSKQPVVVVNYKNGNQTSDFINTYENGKISKESRKDFTANARIETSYLYDEFGRLRKKTNPLGLFEDYGYDTYGRLETITNHKNHITTFG
ncbi:hypothetical protein JZU68_09910, partial [bacterium]|nr:hypothetical protein [bacterium]